MLTSTCSSAKTARRACMLGDGLEACLCTLTCSGELCVCRGIHICLWCVPGFQPPCQQLLCIAKSKLACLSVTTVCLPPDMFAAYQANRMHMALQQANTLSSAQRKAAAVTTHIQSDCVEPGNSEKLRLAVQAYLEDTFLLLPWLPSLSGRLPAHPQSAAWAAWRCGIPLHLC